MRPPNDLRLRWINFDDHTEAAYLNALDAGEQRRARTYVFARDRRQFVVTRAILRAMLADALGTMPAALRFGHGPHNKPCVAWPPAGKALRFNVSHAGGFAVIALSRHHIVGVDVEQVRADLDFAQVAERLFSPRERAELADVAPPMRPGAFFNVWTRKEAYIKARGLGLSLPLDSFDVAAAPAAADVLVATRPDSDDAARWSVQALSAPPGYVAAVAYSVPTPGSPAALPAALR